MSYNLLKHQFVYSEQSTARVINSNQKMKEKMQELIRLYQEEEDGQKGTAINAEFVGGIQADNVAGEDAAVMAGMQESAVIHSVDAQRSIADKIIADAREEADRIIKEAKTSAEQMLAEADEKAKALYEEQRQNGYNDGAADAEKELSYRLANLEDRNATLQQGLEEEFQRKLGTMESDIVEAVIQVFDKVFHIQFEDKQDILLHLVKNTLRSVDPEKYFRILVSEDNWQYVEAHLSVLQEQLGSEVVIEVTRDPKLSNSECRIESDNAVYDCSMDQELDGLCRDIRSLCC